MAGSRAGFTLLEVLVALLLITAGMLGFVGALGPLAELQSRGKLLGRSAMTVQSRLDRLRVEIAAAGCSASGGSETHRSGIEESWVVSSDSVVARVRVIVRRPGRGIRTVDTVETGVPCP